jgi:glycosyltransferase involved in cell wall biosynthesis
MSAPKFSIVVPTRNRPAQLTALLESLTAQHYPRERFEVIVVDDGGTTSITELVRRFDAPLQLQHLRCDHGGPARARQAGVALAQAPYLAFTDDDCRPDPNWLSALESALEQHPTCAIGGRTVNGIPKNLFSEASESLQRFLSSYFATHPREPRFFPTNNVGFAAAGFHAVGGLDRTWKNSGGEDRDLCYRWQQHGFGMVFEPDMIVTHIHRHTWRTFLAQHFRYGRGAFRFRHRHLRGANGRLQLAPLGFYTSLLLDPFIGGVTRQAGAIAALVVFAQAANAVGFVTEALRRPPMDASGFAQPKVPACSYSLSHTHTTSTTGEPAS